jgi:hypothetical protein
LTTAYQSAIDAFRKPPPKPVSLDELDSAYQLGGHTTHTEESAPNGVSWAVRLAGAELMIRAAETNVINVADHDIQSWDFHQTDSSSIGDDGGHSRNGEYSRKKFLGTNGFEGNRIKPLCTFLDRVLNLPDRNVVVCISGEMVRALDGKHVPGSLAAFFGNNIKRGVKYGVSPTATFQAGTPGVKGFWAAAAAAVRAQGTPFGSNPYSDLIG